MHFLKKNKTQAVLLMLFLMLPGISLAITNCDSQAKPAFDCPPGYTMSCVPVGGDHWSCSKPALAEGAAPEPVVSQPVTTPVNTHLAPGGIDDRFIPVGGMPAEVLEQIREAQKISINITGATLRDDVAAELITVRGWDPKQKKITIDPELIRTKENLESYAQAIVLNDPNIIELSLYERVMTLKYQTRGKILGLFPKRLVATISITVPEVSDTAVAQLKVQFPWYYRIMKKQFTAAAVITEFVAQAELLNSQDQTQKVAQYLATISTVLKDKNSIVTKKPTE
jgi:hypothetical protein